MRFSLIIPIALYVSTAGAAGNLVNAMENVRFACKNISAELNDMKNMAGIGTAVSAAGTVAGGVALGTGIAKVGVDKDIQDMEKQLEKLLNSDKSRKLQPIIITDMAKLKHDLDTYQKSGHYETKEDIEQQLSQAEQKSKSLGNWRTGMLATSTATNIAGALIAGNNKVKGDLKTQITRCLAAVKVLSDVRMQARLSQDTTDTELVRAQNIIRACNEWSTVDIDNINKKATNTSMSNSVGAGLGLAGTVTSAFANSAQVRTGDNQKEKNLNTAANVLAGGTTVAAGLATVLNATQIGAIKRAVAVAAECEEALK